MRRWLLDRNMEQPPDWMIEEWNLFQLARWAGVAPWDLAGQPVFWLNKLEFYAGIEEGVQEARLKHVNKSR